MFTGLQISWCTFWIFSDYPLKTCFTCANKHLVNIHIWRNNKWQTLDLTAEMWDIKLFKNCNGTLHPLSSCLHNVLCLTDTERAQANLNQQTFSQYSQRKKCSTKWRTYEFTAKKWEIKLLSIVTELSQLLSFFLSTLLNRRRERTQANTWNTKHNRPRTKNTISLHIGRSWYLKPFFQIIWWRLVSHVQVSREVPGKHIKHKAQQAPHKEHNYFTHH